MNHLKAASYSICGACPRRLMVVVCSADVVYSQIWFQYSVYCFLLSLARIQSDM